MTDTLTCPKCGYENIVVSCGFCLQCGIDLAVPAEVAPATSDSRVTKGEANVADVSSTNSASAPSLDALLGEVAARNGFDLQVNEGRWRFQISLDAGRRQNVLVTADDADTDGDPMLRLVSMCGPAKEKNAMALLKISGHAAYCGFAVRKLGNKEAFVVNATLPSAHVDAAQLAKTLRSIAHHADYVEQRLLSGSDRY